MPPGTKRTKNKKKFTASLNYFKDGSKYNDAEVLKTCMKPKIIFYATKDEFTTPKQVREIYKTIPEPKELHKINCTHDYRLYPDVIKQVNEKVGLFIDKYLSA